MRNSAFLLFAFSAVTLVAAIAGCGGGGSASPPAASLELLAGLAPGAANAAGHVDAVRSDARFSGIDDLAADDLGNVWILEGAASGNHAIRRITASGAVTTVFDYGPDASVELHGIAVDGAGNAFIGYSRACGPADAACLSFGELHRIDATGHRTTVAVTGSSDGSGTQVGKIDALARDRAGNLYFARAFGVRRLSAAGDLTTVAVASNTRLPTTLAVDDAGALYGSGGLGAFAIYRIPGLPVPMSPQPGPPLIVAARGMAIDAQGDFYVADSARHVVLELSPAGVLSEIVGVANRQGFVPGPLPGGLDAPRGVAIHGSDLYIGMDTAVAVVHNRP